MAVSPARGRAPLLQTQPGKYYGLQEKRGKKTAFWEKKMKRERTLLNYLANGSNATANSAGRRRLPEPSLGDGYRRGPAWRVLGAQDGWSQPWAAPAGAAAARGRVGVPPAGIFTPLLRPEPPQPAEGEMSSTPLSAQPRSDAQSRGELPGDQPRSSITCKEPQPQRSLLQQPQPEGCSPKATSSARPKPHRHCPAAPPSQGEPPPRSLSPGSPQSFFSEATNIFL